MDQDQNPREFPLQLKRPLAHAEPKQRKKFRPEDKPFVCECGRSFTLKGNLTKHQKLHSNEKPFHCEVPGCGKTFTQAIGLTRHMMTHNNEKPYVCPVEGCSKAFAQPGNLNAHLRIHTGDKPFVCTSCNRAFAQKGNLTTHMLYHSTEKPFLCQVPGCGQAFSLKGNLKKHAKIHQTKNDMYEVEAISGNPQGQDPAWAGRWPQEGVIYPYDTQAPMDPATMDYQQFGSYPMALHYQQMFAQQQHYYAMYGRMDPNHPMAMDPNGRFMLDEHGNFIIPQGGPMLPGVPHAPDAPPMNLAPQSMNGHPMPLQPMGAVPIPQGHVMGLPQQPIAAPPHPHPFPAQASGPMSPLPAQAPQAPVSPVSVQNQVPVPPSGGPSPLSPSASVTATAVKTEEEICH